MLKLNFVYLFINHSLSCYKETVKIQAIQRKYRGINYASFGLEYRVNIEMGQQQCESTITAYKINQDNVKISDSNLIVMANRRHHDNKIEVNFDRWK